MTRPDAGDDELMAAVREGTVGLLGVLFERHAPLLHAFFRRRGFPRGAAEDLVQDVFLRVLRYRASWRADGPFAAWLWRFAVNVGHDAQARRRNEGRRTSGVGAGSDRAAPPVEATTSPDPGDDPARAPIELEESAVLHAALARLRPEERSVVELRFFGGCDAADLARRFDCTVGAARVRLHRAMVRLRSLLTAREGMAGAIGVRHHEES